MIHHKGNTIEFSRGDAVCSECGTHIRNIVLVNGAPVGTECAKKYLPKSVKVNNGKSFELALQQQIAESNRQLAQALLVFVQSRLGLNRTANEITARVATDLAGNRETYLYWVAYQEARNLMSQA